MPKQKNKEMSKKNKSTRKERLCARKTNYTQLTLTFSLVKIVLAISKNLNGPLQTVDPFKIVTARITHF